MQPNDSKVNDSKAKGIFTTRLSYEICVYCNFPYQHVPTQPLLLANFIAVFSIPDYPYR